MLSEAVGRAFHDIISTSDPKETVGLKWFSLIAATILPTGCASQIADKDCELDPSELEVLQSRAILFLDSKWQPSGAKCEEITDSTQYVRGSGCGIYGFPAGSSKSGCPDALDGDYYVIFDPESLQPSGVVLIAH